MSENVALNMEQFNEGARVWVMTNQVKELEAVSTALPWVKGKVLKVLQPVPERIELEVEIVPPMPELAGIFQFEEHPCALESSVTVVQTEFCRTRTDDESGVDDLVNSDILHEPSVLCGLGIRYAMDTIYTYSGQILIAINPFKPLKHLYGPMMMSKYYNSFLGELSPHVYAIAEHAFKSMLIENCAQSILISGESGAGKTESAKLVMQYLAMRHLQDPSARNGQHSGVSCQQPSQSLSPFTPGCVQRKASSSRVEQQILESNPLLEAFGNAQTVRNSNSSRFGKYVHLKFDDNGVIQDAMIQTYLLERSRVVQVSDMERSYHIFYQIIKGTSEAQKEVLHLSGFEPSDFCYLSSSKTYSVEGIDDGEDFCATQRAMTCIGITHESQESVLKIVSSILHIGNIRFSDALESHSAVMDGSLVQEQSENHLCAAAVLLGVSRDDLELALTTRTIVAPDNTYRKGLPPSDAFKARDAFAKTLYIKLFDWIVKAANENMHLNRGSSIKQTIGILDIYGFESFEKNSFEQLCINLANEHLQQHFNEQVLRHEQEEYTSEGIDWTFVDFKDNQDVLDVIVGTSKKALSGIMPILDECCRLPKTTPRDFTDSLQSKLAENTSIHFHKKAPEIFQVNHYAGPVRYDSTNMIEKNKDYVVFEHTCLAQDSEFEFFRNLFLSESGDGSDATQKKSTFKLKTVSSLFTTQLRALMQDLTQTQPHYIRCIKPNFKCFQGQLVAGYVHEQLCYGGVMEAIRIARCGFPSRKTFLDFVDRYNILLYNLKSGRNSQILEGEHDARDLTRVILKSAVSSGWELGKNKVFMKEGVVPVLENTRNAILEKSAITLQAFYRGRLARQRVARLRYAIILIQSCWRRKLAMTKTTELRRLKAAVRIQSWWRMIRARKVFWSWLLNKKATVIQAHFRGMAGRQQSAVARLALDRRAKRKAATTIQKTYRGHLARQQVSRRKARAQYVHNLEQENEALKLRVSSLERDMKASTEKEEQTRQEATVPPVILQVDVSEPPPPAPVVVASEPSIEMKEELSKLKHQNACFERDIQGLMLSLEKAEKEKENLISKYEKTVKGYELRVNQANDASTATAQVLTQEKEAYAETLNSLNDQLEESLETITGLKNENLQLRQEHEKMSEHVADLENKLQVSQAQEETLRVKVSSILDQEEDAEAASSNALVRTPSDVNRVNQSPHALTFERLSADKQTDFLQLIKIALRCQQYINRVSASAYWISLGLWEWAREWNPTELQVILDFAPGHILAHLVESINTQDTKKVYYLLNTMIYLSILTKHVPPLVDFHCSKTSILQLTVFSVKIGPDNTQMFNKLRHMLCQVLQPARLVADGAAHLKGTTPLKGRLIVPSAVRNYLDDFENVIGELKSAQIQASIVKAFVLDILHLTDVEILNQLLLRRECCSTSCARILDLTLRQVEKWCLTCCSDLNITSPEIRWCLRRSSQACNFLLVHKTDIARAYRHGIPLGQLLKSKTDKLNLQQVYRLVAYHHDDWILGNRMNSESISLLHGLKKEIAMSKCDVHQDDVNTGSPNHAAMTWTDDNDSELLLDIEHESSNLQSSIASAIRSFGKECPSEDVWSFCLKDDHREDGQCDAVQFPEELTDNPRLNVLKDVSLLEAF